MGVVAVEEQIEARWDRVGEAERGHQGVGFVSIGQLRMMALARGRARNWSDLSVRTMASLAGVPVGRLPAVAPLGSMKGSGCGDSRKVPVMEVQHNSINKHVQITDKENLASPLKSASPLEPQQKQTPYVNGNIEPTPDTKVATSSGKKGKRKTQKKAAADEAESDKELLEVTERFKSSLNLVTPQVTRTTSEDLDWETWLKRFLATDQRAYFKQKEELSSILFTIFDQNVTQGRLSDRVTLEWNKRFNTTAGMTHFRMKKISKERYAGLVLSVKVLDSPIKLYRTLAHELCHAAQWVIDAEPKPPHGDPFKKWVYRFQQFDPSLIITTRHQYDIDYRYKYQCESCHHTYGRHSKSIDVNRKVCGNCRGKLMLLPVDRRLR